MEAPRFRHKTLFHRNKRICTEVICAWKEDPWRPIKNKLLKKFAHMQLLAEEGFAWRKLKQSFLITVV